MTNISLQSVIGPRVKYVSEDNAASIESLPEAAWAAMVEAWNDYNGSDDATPGIDCSVAATHETLADFDATRAIHWSECGTREEATFGGFHAVKYERFQLRRGQPRRDVMIVIDLGDIRAALT